MSHFLNVAVPQPTTAQYTPHNYSLGSVYQKYILQNYGKRYKDEVRRVVSLKSLVEKKRNMLLTEKRPVGIVGAGFAGLYAGLLLQSVGIECEVFEKSDRVGGRIYTWYDKEYNDANPDTAGLYGEVGGMRIPQYAFDMLPVQHLSLVVNFLLERMQRPEADKIFWRKFAYSSPQQRIRYNHMKEPITAAQNIITEPIGSIDDKLGFSHSKRGNIPDIWFTVKQVDSTSPPSIPILQIQNAYLSPFLQEFNKSFAAGFEKLLQYDGYSMWSFLTTIFRLGDLGAWYDPQMGPKSDFLPWPVALYLETTSIGTGMNELSFTEMVIAVYDWNGARNDFNPSDPNVYMITGDKGLQHFPDACRDILNWGQPVTPYEGELAQVLVGMKKDDDTDKYIYNPPNLCPDARPPLPPPEIKFKPRPEEQTERVPKDRVLMEQNVLQITRASRNEGDPQMIDLKIRDIKQNTEEIKTYPFVIATLPFGCYLNGETCEMVPDLSFRKATAIRDSNYLSAFKAFITFREQFWKRDGNLPTGYGAAVTDRSIRQIIYPSYGYDSTTKGVLQIYCWSQDAERLGALDENGRINECLKGIRSLYSDLEQQQGVDIEGLLCRDQCKTWFWDEHAGGGAFALFSPNQFKYIYPSLLTPEFEGSLLFAGEAASVHHGWIVGALDSAFNAVWNILYQIDDEQKTLRNRLTQIWGQFMTPDVLEGPQQIEYALTYRSLDREAKNREYYSLPGKKYIYGSKNEDFVFNGDVPAIVKDYSVVPESMKMSKKDLDVKQMLDEQWNLNVALRAEKLKAQQQQQQQQQQTEPVTAVELLEQKYYGKDFANFCTIPAPRFWLKDDDEFARQQLGGYMPVLLEKLTDQVAQRLKAQDPTFEQIQQQLKKIDYVADYRQYMSACTVTPEYAYLAKPIIFFRVKTPSANYPQVTELLPIGIQLDQGGELFTPDMENHENAWLLAKMVTNCAGQTLHDVGYHQLLTHQICVMISISLFSPEIFTISSDDPAGAYAFPFQTHPVFRLLRPHLVKAIEFQQNTVYNNDYDPLAGVFPLTRAPTQNPGVYQIDFVYDMLFSCGRLGNYQLQDRMYNSEEYSFENLNIEYDAKRRGVEDTPFSYPFVHDCKLWYVAIKSFVEQFVAVVYPQPQSDQLIQQDAQLQRFFNKLIPAYNNNRAGTNHDRFPASVSTSKTLTTVLINLIFQFTVQHTVVNDGSYEMGVFVPNASFLMYHLPKGKSNTWTAQDVIKCLPDDSLYPELGNMNFMDLQINSALTGQGPYPDTIFGRGVLEPNPDFLQDTYTFADPKLRDVVNNFYYAIKKVQEGIRRRQKKDICNYTLLHPDSVDVPNTALFDLITPSRVMNAIQT